MSRTWACRPVLGLLLLAGSVGGAHGQCLLANPSFELSGSGSSTFAGWNQFGNVGSATPAPHGAAAARVTGPDTGGWDVSGYWQRLDTTPGDRWSASVEVSHSPTHPLTGGSIAILNIEWRTASGSLISYESHSVADASTPAGEFHVFSVESGPAPAGTAATHFLLGVLQSPADPPPDVFYDQATFEELGPPTLDELQWSDFPGGRTLSFSGRTWRVKGPGMYGPGPNLFCDDPGCVWLDADDRLHMTIRNFGGYWYSSEVTLTDPLGYGDYIFTTVGRLDALDPNAVLGLFLWQYGRCFDPAYLWWNPYNEIDIEFSRWGNPGSDVAQFVAQPFDYPGNTHRFDAGFSAGELTSHAFRWKEDRVEYRSWRGGPGEEAAGTTIESWTYSGPHLPRPEQPRVHINLWQYGDSLAGEQEVVLDSFAFIPEGGTSASVPAVGPVLSSPRPNPFFDRTWIHFAQREAGAVEVVVYDISGRMIRTLSEGNLAAGEHDVAWDGRTDDGAAVAPGLYFVRIRAGARAETRRVVLLR